MPPTELSQYIENLLSPNYPQDGPGAAVIVTRDGEVLFRKGYGLANLELCVSVEADMVFRIGSVTKQFTAVSILMLLEQGKLSLDDPIEKYLVGYPTHGHTITIEHLLTHTSGIKSYTSMEGWMAEWGRDFTLAGLIDYFKNQPMDFAPGKRWSYSNSGYVLLGAIIEKASGQSYEEFVQKNIFDPLEMRRTYTNPGNRVISRRAYGYDKGPEGYTCAAYLSMTQPHAAGVISSTVDDLARWDAALTSGRLVQPETLQRAFTSYRLPDGKLTHYGYGWGLHDYAGHAWIEHGGGIHGFVCQVARIPDERLFIAVLSNNTSAEKHPGELTFRILTCALGRPYQDPAVVALPGGALAALAGVYRAEENEERFVSYDEGKLFFQYSDKAPRWELQPISPEVFVSAKMGIGRLLFLRDAGGTVTGFEHHSAFDEIDETAQKTEKPLPIKD